jgi:hypothetical protein
MSPTGRVSQSHLHCYRSATVPRKELEGYKGSFVRCLRPVVMALEEPTLLGVRGLVVVSARSHSFWNPVTKHVIFHGMYSDSLPLY